MFWSTSRILKDAAIDRIAIEVVLLGCCRTSIVLQISPATAKKKAISVTEFQSEHWSFVVFSQSWKISVWFMSFSNFWDASLNLLIFCVWLSSLRNCSLYWCASNFSINLATVRRLCSTCCWTVEMVMSGTLYSTMLHPVSRKPCASLCVSQNDLASGLGTSYDPHREFALSTTRGLPLSLW